MYASRENRTLLRLSRGSDSVRDLQQTALEVLTECIGFADHHPAQTIIIIIAQLVSFRLLPKWWYGIAIIQILNCDARRNSIPKAHDKDIL